MLAFELGSSCYLMGSNCMTKNTTVTNVDFIKFFRLKCSEKQTLLYGRYKKLLWIKKVIFLWLMSVKLFYSCWILFDWYLFSIGGVEGCWILLVNFKAHDYLPESKQHSTRIITDSIKFFILNYSEEYKL